MRLLFLHTHIQQHCGISALIRLQARALQERGHDVHIAALDTPMAREYLADVAPFVGLPLDQYAKTAKNFTLSLTGLIQLIRRQRIDVVIASHRWASFVAYMATRVTSSRLVSVDHNVLWGNKRMTFWGDGVIAVSENSRDHLIDYFDVSPEKIRLIQNAMVPIPRASSPVQQQLLADLNLQTSQDGPIFLTVGRLDEQKGLSYLLDAMPQIIDALPHVRLVIVGTGELEGALKKQARSLEIEQHVIFAGLRADVATFLSIADLFLMPSLWEGLPISMLEAMSIGLPVVATNVGGIPEVMALSNPPAGILVPPKESHAFGEAAIALWQDTVRRTDAAKSAYSLVRQHFSDTEMVNQMEEYLFEFV